MKVLVCVKRVPAPGARIVLTPDQRAIEAGHLSFTTSPHEECAVEAAIQIKEAVGGSVTVLTVGPNAAEEQLRYAASVGADEAVLVPTGGEDLDPQATAAALLDAVTGLEQDEPFDLLLFGNESADSGGFQVAIRVAHGLGRPVVTGIKGIELIDGAVRARRQVANGFEVYELPVPAVLAVREGINLPRYPTLSGRLRSKKLDISRHTVALAPGGQRMIRLETPPELHVTTEILDGPAAAVDVLEALGVL